MKRVCTYIRITKPELAPSAFERYEERLNQLIAEQCSWIRAKQYREIAPCTRLIIADALYIK